MTHKIAIIGGGPSGLMAADILSSKNYDVTIYERKPTFGRKFLMAGRGGLNITHSEDIGSFVEKYGVQMDVLKPVIENFNSQQTRDWCGALGEETFIGTSGRVFPKTFKASPLLRAWLARLENRGVTLLPNYYWQGWGKQGLDKDELMFKTPKGEVQVQADVTLLALGGASWPRLGADGSWVDILKSKGVDVSALRPSNCGFFVKWSDFFSQKFKGTPLKSVQLSFKDKKINGEFIITGKGIEGGAVYTLSSFLRDEIDSNGFAHLMLDLKPDLSMENMITRLEKPRRKMSLSNFLRKTLKLSDVAVGLLMEKLDRTKLSEYTPEQLTRYIKSYELRLHDSFSIDRAISTAGGVRFTAVDKGFMLKGKDGVFVAGEMLDWEAPTGGYLLQACMASGVHVARAMSDWLTD